MLAVEVVNESHMHSVPKGSETHLKVVVVTDKFQGMSVVERHRAVNKLLEQEFHGGLHALSIVARTAQQWESSKHAVPSSPNCMGGSKHDAKV